MISNGSQVLKRISIAQFTGLLQSLGYRGRIIRPDLVHSASDGMEWCVELWPEGEAETLVFKSELIVAHDPVADLRTDSYSSVDKLVRNIVLTTLAFEVFFAAVLSARFFFAYDYGFSTAAVHGVFHSISTCSPARARTISSIG